MSENIVTVDELVIPLKNHQLAHVVTPHDDFLGRMECPSSQYGRSDKGFCAVAVRGAAVAAVPCHFGPSVTKDGAQYFFILRNLKMKNDFVRTDGVSEQKLTPKPLALQPGKEFVHNHSPTA